MKCLKFAVRILTAILPICSLYALEPSADELRAAETWQGEVFGADGEKLPFSFLYDGKKAPAADWMRGCCRRDGGSTVLRFVSPDRALAVDCEIRRDPGFPVLSWLLRFTNLSKGRTKVVAKVRPFDLRVPVASKSKTHLVHHAAGAMQSLDDYQQFTTLLSQEWWRQHRLHVQTAGGRSCEAAWPYFNLETPDAKAGLIAAIGWAGQWEADFDATGDDRLKMTAGMSDSNFCLEPGESLRGPRAVVLLYRRGDWLEGQNLWRQWFLRFNAPRQNGRLVESQTMCALGDGTSFDSDRLSAESMKRYIDGYAAHGITFDYWWIDAAWYQWKNQWNDPKTKAPHWRWTGNWTPDPVRFPKGPGEVFAYAKEKCGAKGGILWFEIENAVTSAPVHQEHPDWFYPTPAYRGHFLDWSKKEAWDWAFGTVDGTLRREGVNFYRQDFNFPPLHIWRDNDRRAGTDRTGVSEMKHVEALYRFYGALLKADPSRRIDNCAQGGTRNDVETLSYAVPLWRTDTSGPVDEQQMQTAGISLWVPLYGGGTPRSSALDGNYDLRSRLQPYIRIDLKQRPEMWDVLKRHLAEWRKYCAPYYVKDFYPLTRSDAGADLWCAWEFVDAEKGEGFVQAFRRADATSPSFLVRPRGLDAAKSYVFEDIDTREGWTIRGNGEFEIRAEKPRTAKILAFRPASSGATVEILGDAMRKFLARPRWERMGLMLDPAFRAEALKAGSRPKPCELKVASAAGTVEVYRVADRKLVRTVPVKDGVAKLDNLEVATKYVWRAMSGGKAVAKGKFETEDGVPRICRIDGIGNVRDFGGRTMADGHRVRQGLVYRSAAFNRTASTPKDKARWKPGKTFLTEAARAEAQETFGFRTDLDLRTDWECFGMEGSPLGADVRWVRIESSNYGDMRNPKAREAFARCFRTVSDAKNLPLVFHCVGGADRTGSLAWILGGILGEKEEDLYHDWELTVFNYDPPKFNHWNFIGGLVRMLDELYPKRSPQEQCVAYAKDCGISDDEIASFRNLMLESQERKDGK